MDMIDIVPHDADDDLQNAGSDIDAEDILDDFDEENGDDNGENGELEPDNAILVDNNAAAGVPGAALPRLQAGGAAQQWTHQLTAVPNDAFSGNISLFFIKTDSFCHIFTV
jgi:hypothetical protein